MTDNVNELIKKAAEAAKNAPDHLQEAAFNKAFDLYSSQSIGNSPSKSGKTGTRKPKAKVRDEVEIGKSDKSLNDLDRTAHPEINYNNSALINSLYLLKAAKDDLGIDGLNAGEVAEVLVDKFRCTITKRAIQYALNDAGKYVNRVKEGRTVIYKIMSPGEDYLESHDSSTSTNKKSTSTKKRKSKKTQKKKGNSNKNNSTNGKRIGPATAMSKLLQDGFFQTGKSISEIIEKLKHDRGRSFKSNELSPVLLRWLRNGTLTREKNSENQYEYKEA